MGSKDIDGTPITMVRTDEYNRLLTEIATLQRTLDEADQCLLTQRSLMRVDRNTTTTEALLESQAERLRLLARADAAERRVREVEGATEKRTAAAYLLGYGDNDDGKMMRGYDEVCAALAGEERR